MRLLKTRSKRMERYRRAHTHTHAHTHTNTEKERKREGNSKREREREKGAEGERRRITVPLRSALPPSLLPLLCAVLQRLAPLFNRDTASYTYVCVSVRMRRRGGAGEKQRRKVGNGRGASHCPRTAQRCSITPTLRQRRPSLKACPAKRPRRRERRGEAAADQRESTPQ